MKIEKLKNIDAFTQIMSLENMKNAAFSKAELKEANVPLSKLLFNGFRMDVRRKTMNAANVEILKKLELKDPPAKKPKVKKEKKAKPVKAAVKKEEKVAAPSKGSKVASLSDLEGIKPAQVQKLKDLGIDTPEKLAGEDIKELATLSKLTQKQLKTWIDQING